MSSIFPGFKRIHLVQILGTIKTDIHDEFRVQVGKVGEKVMITKHPFSYAGLGGSIRLSCPSTYTYQGNERTCRMADRESI